MAKPGNDYFDCVVCGLSVLPLRNGSYRNHCPHCLHSLHVDAEEPGDRRSECRGVMAPVGLEKKAKKGFQIVFRCQKCGTISRNKAALDDPVQPDRHESILAVARNPVF